MKAFAVYPGLKSYQVTEVADPGPLQPNQVRLRMLDIGICGTDKEITAFEYGTPPSGSDYLILGHESLGRVVECGDQVTRVRPGLLVVPTVRRPCPHTHCRSCRAGRQDFCFTGDFTERGIKGLHGFLAEYVVEEEQYLSPVPEVLRDVAVLVEPLTIAEKAMKQMWQVQERLPWANDDYHCDLPGQGHEALVLGAGPVGLLGALKLVSLGFETFVYSRLHGMEMKRQLVESIGATFIEAETVPADRIHDHAPRIDVVYEAVGASSLAFEVLHTLDANGVFIFTGVPGRRGPIQLDSDRLMRNLVLSNQIVFGTVNAGLDSFAEAIGDLVKFRQRWPGSLRSLITERLPVERAADVLEGRIHGIKSVVQFPE